MTSVAPAEEFDRRDWAWSIAISTATQSIDLVKDADGMAQGGPHCHRHTTDSATLDTTSFNEIVYSMVVFSTTYLDSCFYFYGIEA